MNGRIGSRSGGSPDPAYRGTPERRLRRLAFEQAGYFTVGQVLDIGYCAREIGDNLARDAWQRVDRELFRLPDWPHSDTEEFARWCLWAGERGVISHQSAAGLHGLGTLRPYFVHLVAPDGVNPTAPQVVVHHESLAPTDVERVQCFPITTAVRTVCDLADVGISQHELDLVVGDAVRREDVTVEDLEERTHELTDHGSERLLRALEAGLG
ncbi:hypothetical protein G4X40_07335 [Rhodococcus sp. D2-41]|uniref:type IV toxin-antitoxin system AbiEi family antitoxin domain-containing protein n=1 Tax=Speluncibacter jeojiensis TaxID=2710754 RepID=UPI00240ED1BA|nr:hypothetical protein [Rhodococcus sp. D2-41]MDG3009958.1 hypothetical protein [Rhodococcus sp. D2-41]